MTRTLKPRPNALHRRCLALAAGLALVLAAAPATASEDAPAVLGERIINGELAWGSPSVGFFVNPRTGGTTSCSGTLVGCRTFVTAAHCPCLDFGVDPPELLTGAACQDRPDLLEPAGKRVFFQHAGFVGVSEVVVHPEFLVGQRSDLAILRLDRPVSGVRPARINQAARPAVGTPAVIMGFGQTGGGPEDYRGLKRFGRTTLAPCVERPENEFLCYDYALPAPADPPGYGSGASGGDSGGPLFVDLGAGPVLAAVTSGARPIPPAYRGCAGTFNGLSSDVFFNRDWIEPAAGADLHATDCGALPFAGEDGSSILFGEGELSEAEPEARFSLEVPSGTEALRVSLNSELPFPTREASFSNHFTLHLRHGEPPTPGASDCASEEAGGLQFCEVAGPEPGTWHVLARRIGGHGAFQVTATLLGEAGPGGAPDPPPGPWLSSPALPGFEAKVRIGGSTEGALEEDCIAETLCVSGALAGRPEIFVKVIGPRPNGFLWAQISRFTPSRVEVWLRQSAAGEVVFYELPAVGPGTDDVSGRQDREAFSPGLEPQ